MAEQSLSRGQRILALIQDWLIVLGVIFGGLELIGLPGIMNLVILALLVLIIVLIPAVSFKLLKLAIGMTLGRVFLIGLRRLYHRARASESIQ